MIKHIITPICNRECSYCITRNLKNIQQKVDWLKIEEVYHELSLNDHEIMLTGGEPTMARSFWMTVRLAKEYFDRVYITTQNENIITDEDMKIFDAITFSIHDLEITKKYNLFIPEKLTVYGAIMADLYNIMLPYHLMIHGFKGLTINEDHRGTEEFKETLPHIPDFSIRVNRRGKCMDSVIILPDLKVITDFTPYL